MRKVLAWFVICAFIVGVAGIAYAQANPAKVRAYINQLEEKLAGAKEPARIAKLKKMIAEQKVRLAELEAESAPPAPPAPPRPVVAAPAPASAGLFGWGLNTSANVGYLAGNSEILAGGYLLLDDPLALGTLVGLSDKAVQYRVGLGLNYGNDINSRAYRALALVIDGIINLPAEALGVASYIGGGINYPIYRTTGSIGGQIYFGIQGDLGLGLGGNSFAELGYAIIRDTNRSPATSARGISLQVGQQILL